MKTKGTSSVFDFIEDYDRTYKDYVKNGALWAEMTFGDDYEAMRNYYAGLQTQPSSEDEFTGTKVAKSSNTR